MNNDPISLRTPPYLLNKSRGLVFMLLLALLLGGTSLAYAEPRQGEITKQCRIKVPGGKQNREKITDRKYMTSWQSGKGNKASLTITLPEGVRQGGIYITWDKTPESWTLRQGEDIIQQSDDNAFAHVHMPFEGGQPLHLEIKAPKGKPFGVGELFVYAGETPGWVQQWQPTQPRADLLVLVAHPDDELLFMGGAIPYYQHEQGKQVVVSYMTCANGMRRSEMLNGLWEMGVRHDPVIGGFRDVSAKSMDRMYEIWKGDQAQAYIVELLRRFRPQVVLSHDLKGEYGHPAHRAVAEMALKGVEAAGQQSLYPESAAAYGAWQVDKLYLHLYPDNPITMDWSKPLTAFGGKTAMEVADMGYAMHRSQRARHQMGMNASYDATRFGLAYTMVGLDAARDDFFEHIDTSRQAGVE